MQLSSIGECFFFFSSLKKTPSLPIISTPAHLQSVMLRYLGSRFAHIDPTTSLPVSSYPFCQHFVFFQSLLSSLDPPLSWLSSSPSLPPIPSPLHRASLLTLSASSFLSPPLAVPVLISFFFSSPTASHTPPRPFAVSTHISLYSFPLVFFDSTTSPLCCCPIPNMHCIPIAHALFVHPLSGSTQPPSGTVSLSGNAHWSNTCHSVCEGIKIR